MKTRMALCLAAGLLLGADDPANQTAVTEVKQALDSLNEAFAKGNATTCQGLMTEDHLAITSYYGGPLKRAEQLQSLAEHKLAEYAVSKMQVKLLGQDVALVTYAVTMKGTYKGREVPPRSFASAIWVKRSGKWLEALYQETPLPEK